MGPFAEVAGCGNGGERDSFSSFLPGIESCRSPGPQAGVGVAALPSGKSVWPDSLVLPCRVAVEVVTTMTSADVMWQDGSVECNIRSNDLFPVHHLDNNEFCPGDFVVDKRGSVAPGRGNGQGLSGRRLPFAVGSLLWGLGCVF